jgi:hypothetical protein
MTVWSDANDSVSVASTHIGNAMVLSMNISWVFAFAACEAVSQKLAYIYPSEPSEISMVDF